MSPGDGECDDGKGECTFRAAIQESNYSEIESVITFDIPGSAPHTIRPGSPLPPITRQVALYGIPESQYYGGELDMPAIEIDGSKAGESVSGLIIEAEDVVIRGLVINRFGGDGIKIRGGTAGLRNNFIGTDITGATDAGNGGHGVHVTDGGQLKMGDILSAGYSQLADDEPMFSNLVSANRGAGVMIEGGSRLTTHGNRVGVDITRKKALGNTGGGIVVIGSSAEIGGGRPLETGGNLIAGNGSSGIRVVDTQSVSIQDNQIGATIRTGPNHGDVIDLGNEDAGISVERSDVRIVGNNIATNSAEGIRLHDSSTAHISLNEIGGHSEDNPDEGNGGAGISIDSTSSASIGEITNVNKWHFNTIGFNAEGIYIQGDGSVIIANVIRDNKGAGIRISGGSNNVIGGPEFNDFEFGCFGDCNAIVSNGGPGVVVEGEDATGNTITRNAIYDNNGPGIDLGGDGATPNDDGDGDAGPNGLLNTPVLTSVTPEQAEGRACAGCVVEVFVASPDPSGYGEASKPVGAGTVDADGLFSVALQNVDAGDSLTATATDAGGNTSEFSAVAGP